MLFSRFDCLVKIITVKYVRLLALIVAGSLLLNACSSGWVGSSDQNNNKTYSSPNSSLLSSVPIINDVPTQFYVYVYNGYGTDINNLSWSIKNNDASTNQSTVNKVRSWFGKVLASQAHLLETNIDPLNIIDATNCNTIVSGTACRILLSANKPGSALLEGRDDKGNVVVSEIPSSYSYTTTNGTGSNSLILSPLLPMITLRGGLGATSFFVINNSASLIDISNLLDTLPSGVSLQLVNCANPLPSGRACQVRMTFSFSNTTSLINMQVIVKLNGSIINQDGSKTALPDQNSSAIITVTNNLLANLQASYLSLALNGNSPDTSTTIGYIKNSGTNVANIGKLSIANSAFTLINDECSNHNLDPTEVCSYSVKANLSSINQSGTTAVTVPYNNGLNEVQTTAVLNYSYIFTAPANPQIGLSAPDSLTQTTTSGNITITNNGNVALSNVSMPTIKPANSHLLLTDPNNCSSMTLQSGSSCSYLITYSPQAPSEDSSVTLGDITASYLDPVTKTTQSITFTNSTGININSIFSGYLTMTPESLNDTITTTSATITNTGNASVNISNITIIPGGGNVQTNGGTCNNSTTLNPSASCSIQVQLINALTAGSGNSILIVNYNDNNGNTSATATSNISWIVGDAPNLNISFSPGSLLVTVGGTVNTTITLTNNGNNSLNNIQLPILPESLSYVSGGSCNLSNQQLVNQMLNKGESCTVILKYSPTISQASDSINFVISATYGVGQNYTTDPYALDLTALAPSTLIASPASLTPSLNWTNSTSYTTSISIANVGSSAANLNNIISSNPSIISTSGCTGSLPTGESCTLLINGIYPVQTTSYTDNSNITINYSDSGGDSYSTTINIQPSLIMKPVVTGALGISGVLPVSLAAGTPATTVVTLTNNSIATNNGDASIKVNMDSLTGSGFIVNNGGGGTVSATLNTINVSNPCGSTTVNITLAQGVSCNVNMVLTASGTVAVGNSTPQITIKPNYSYKVYSNLSTTPSDSALTDTASPLIQSITVTDPAAALSFSYSPSSISAERLSTPNPVTATLTVTNVGSASMTGIIMPTNINGVSFSGQNGCSNLATGSSCNITVSVSTDTVISGNLNSSNVLFTDTYNTSGQSVNLSSFSYSVSAPGVPNITVAASTNNCSSVGGNGISGTCLLNPSADTTSSGSAGSMRLIVTYTNQANAQAKNFTVNANPPTNYTLTQNNCVQSTLNFNGSCTVIYQISNPSSSLSNLDVPQNTSLDNGYSYDYGSQGQIPVSVGDSKPLAGNLIVSSTQPSLSLSFYNQMLTDSSQNAVVTLSSWYINGGSANVSFDSSDDKVINKTECSIGEISFGSGNCSATLYSTPEIGSSTILATTSAPNGDMIYSNSVELNTTNTFVYAASTKGVYQCVLSNTGTVIKCNYPSETPEAKIVAFNGNYAYITNSSSQFVMVCSISSDGLGGLSRCFTDEYPFKGVISGVAFNNGYAYVSEVEGQVSVCVVDQETGQFKSCEIVVEGLGSSLTSISFNGSFAYITDLSGKITKCNAPPDDGGRLTGCEMMETMVGDGKSNLYGLAFYNGENVTAYALTDAYIYQCNVVDNVIIDKCSQVIDGLSMAGISYYNGNVYFSNSSNYIATCPIDTDGNLTKECDSGLKLDLPGLAGLAVYPSSRK